MTELTPSLAQSRLARIVGAGVAHQVAQRAKANGVKMGRPQKLTARQKKEAIKRRDQGEETLAEIGRSYNVSIWTISRITAVTDEPSLATPASRPERPWDVSRVSYRFEIVAFLDYTGQNASFESMEIRIPPHQEARLAALAARLGRSPDEIVAEAITFWELRVPQRLAAERRHSPAQAAAKILELRKGNVLPVGESIKDLINFGRA